MSDVHAECAPEAPMDPTDPWGTLGAHVVEAKGARGARVGGGVSVVSLEGLKTHDGGEMMMRMELVVSSWMEQDKQNERRARNA